MNLLTLYHVFEVTDDGLQPEIITRPDWLSMWDPISCNRRLRTFKSLAQAKVYRNRLVKENRTARIYQVDFWSDGTVDGFIVKD